MKLDKVLSRGSIANRSRVPISAYVGSNGSGKSLCAVIDAMTHLSAGRPVLSSIPLFDWEQSPGTLHPNYVPLTDWRQLLDFEGGHLLLDEVTGFADSRQSSTMPAQVRSMLVQLRKRDVTLAWTCPDYSMSDVTIRRVTQSVTLCRSFWRKPVEDAIWQQASLFLFRTYDAHALDQFSEDRRDKLRPLVRQVFFAKGSDAFRAYDTLAKVELHDHQNLGGTCVHCFGKITARRCQCESEV